MDSIVVNVSELLSRLQEIQRDGMDYVELFLIEAGDELPACVNLSLAKHLIPEHGPIMRKSMHLKLKALDFPISSALF